MKTPYFWRDYNVKIQNSAESGKLSRTEASLSLLVLSKDPEVVVVCDRLTKILRGDAWSWIQDETLTDSTLAVLAIYSYRPAEVDGICLAYLTNKMLENEVEVGGPYFDTRQKTDFITNFVISRLFRQLGSPLSNVEKFLKKYDSPELPGGSALTIYNLLFDWPIFSKSKLLKTVSDMPLLTEALRHKNISKQTRLLSTPLHQIISKNVYEELQVLSDPLRTHATSVWKTVNLADTNHEIAMMSAHFADSLKDSQPVRKKTLVDLGMANFFVWMAYTIYDDFIDDEGQIELLPVANSMLRRGTALYEKTSRSNVRLLQEVLKTFDKMDRANSWELAYCRYKVENNEIVITSLPTYANFDILADRALGHVLGPMIITEKSQVTPKQQENIQKGLRHFLIAKQLSDDLKDWAEDLEKGHITAVVARFLKRMKTKPGLYDLPAMTYRMKEYFWSQGRKDVNDIILKQLARSKDHFKKSSILSLDGNFFLHVFEPLEEAVRENELKYTHQQQFLAAYSDEYRKEL